MAKAQHQAGEAEGPYTLLLSLGHSLILLSPQSSCILLTNPASPTTCFPGTPAAFFSIPHPTCFRYIHFASHPLTNHS